MAYQNSPKIVTNGLVLCLDAGNTKSYPGTGTVWYDLYKSGNNGTLTNGPTFNSANGGSIVFDGTNDYVSSNYQLSPTAYTKIAWFYPTSFTPSNNIISGNNEQHAFWLAGGNKLYSGHNGNWYTVQSATTLSLNTWYFGAATFSTSAGWKLYLNGNLEATNASTSTFTGPGNINIGAYYQANNFQGRISNVQIYTRVLSDSEILQNYNATKSRFGL